MLEFLTGYAAGEVTTAGFGIDSELKRGRDWYMRFVSDSLLLGEMSSYLGCSCDKNKITLIFMGMFSVIDLQRPSQKLFFKVTDPLRDAIAPAALLTAFVAGARLIHKGSHVKAAGLLLSLLIGLLQSRRIIEGGYFVDSIRGVAALHNLAKGSGLQRVNAFLTLEKILRNRFFGGSTYQARLFENLFNTKMDLGSPAASLTPDELYQTREVETKLNFTHLDAPCTVPNCEEDLTEQLKTFWDDWKFEGDEEVRFNAARKNSERSECDPKSELKEAVSVLLKLDLKPELKKKLENSVRYIAKRCVAMENREAVFKALLELTFEMGGKCNDALINSIDGVAFRLAAAETGQVSRDFPILIKVLQARQLAFNSLVECKNQASHHRYAGYYYLFSGRYRLHLDYGDEEFGTDFINRIEAILAGRLWFDSRFKKQYAEAIELLIEDSDVCKWWADYFKTNEHEELLNLVSTDMNAAKKLMLLAMGVLEPDGERAHA